MSAVIERTKSESARKQRNAAGIALRPEALKPSMRVQLEENEEMDWTPPELRVLQKGARINASNEHAEVEVSVWQDDPDNHNIAYLDATFDGREGPSYEPGSGTKAFVSLATTVETLELFAQSILRAVREAKANGLVTTA